MTRSRWAAALSLVLAATWAPAQDPNPSADSGGGETPEAYVARREKELKADDLWGHLELADLARSTGQAEAGARHAKVVLELSGGKNALAHEILGEVFHQGKWITPEGAKAAGLVEYHGEWLTKEDYAEHVRRSDWGKAWRIERAGVDLDTNTSRSKSEKYFKVFMDFKREMEATFHVELTSKYHVNVYATKSEYHTISGGPPGTGGFYSPGGRDFHFFDDPDFFQARRIFFHEGTHMFVNLTNNNKAFHYPNWLNEGMAEYFGGSKLDYKTGRYSFGHVLNDRLEKIQKMVTAGSHSPLPKFLAQEGLAGAYDQGWSIVLFLQKRDGGKWGLQFGAFLKALRDSRQAMNPLKRGPETVATFKKFFLRPGQDLADFEKEWIEFVKGLKPEPGAPDFRKMKSMHG
ncbi:MAG: DUF1570 domain-containing protein [Planctomycetales bacterium]|nr:DUF1570 domain-containing protein [Planctomycetales bacterium]